MSTSLSAIPVVVMIGVPDGETSSGFSGPCASRARPIAS
jgi:hypothetical protein